MDNEKMKKFKDDPSFTLAVQNPEVEELLTIYANEKNAENLNKLIDKCTKSRFLVPCNVNEDKKPVPVLIKNKIGESFLPIYTSKEQLPKDHPTPAIVNMPYLAINNMAAKKETKLDGVAFNPFTNNLIFRRPLVEKIETVEKARREGKLQKPKAKTVQMTEQQYTIFERLQFEHMFLPTKMFAGGKEFMTELADRKEQYIDELYEESYQQKRMYPYMEEDFSVMSMQISEELNVTRVDFPTRNFGPGCAVRAYLVWDEGKNSGRYFSIDATKENTTELIEMTPEHMRISHGEAPVEGAELQTVLDMLEDNEEAAN